MSNDAQPKMRSAFVLDVHACLQDETREPQSIRGHPLRVGWEYDNSTASGDLVWDLTVALMAEGDDKDSPLLECSVTVRSVWDATGVDPEGILLRHGALHLLQKQAADAVQDLFQRLGVGPVELDPADLEYEGGD